MPSITQENRPLSLVTPLGADALLLRKMSGIEAVSSLFHYQLDLLAENAANFSSVLGQPATISLALPNGTRRYVNGIIVDLAQGDRVTAPTEKTKLFSYRAELVPTLWWLTQRVQSRVMRVEGRQQLTVPEILTQVLSGEWHLPVRFSFSSTYQPRNYCVQYRESDFDFVSRLMEEEGIWYYFEHEADKHTLVVTDQVATYSQVPEPTSITFEEIVGGQRGEPRVVAWEKSQKVHCRDLRLQDYRFEKPESRLEAFQPFPSRDVKFGQVQHALNVRGAAGARAEFFEYPAGYATRFDGTDAHGAPQPRELEKLTEDGIRTLRIRLDQEIVEGLTARGRGDCAHFTPGLRFDLERHFDANGSYLLTRVEHSASLEGTYPKAGGATQSTAFLYENRFECVPASLAYRSRRATPRPRIDGVQTATVVGLGDNPFIDAVGRVKVRFNWDRDARPGADSSCWVRVSQVWAGNGWGAFFWPRPGHEVVVAFEEGDPDRPLVVGSVYNGKNQPPFSGSHDMAGLNGIKSCSLQGGNPLYDFNGLLFHDMKGVERLTLASRRNIHINSDHDTILNAGGRIEKNCPDLNFERSGGLALPGSGSGGGDADPRDKWNWSFKDKTPMEISFKPTQSFKASYGLDGKAFLGLGFSYSLGSSWKIGVNPLGLLGECDFAAKASSGIPSAMIGLVGGDIGLTVGSSTKFSYGPSFAFGHGRDVKYIANEKDSDEFLFLNRCAKAFAGILSITTALEMIVIGFGPAIWTGMSENAFIAFMAVTTTLNLVAMGLLMAFELKLYTLINASKDLLKQKFSMLLISESKSLDLALQTSKWMEKDLKDAAKVNKEGNPVATALNNPAAKATYTKSETLADDCLVRGRMVRLEALTAKDPAQIALLALNHQHKGEIFIASDHQITIYGGGHNATDKGGVKIHAGPSGQIDIGSEDMKNDDSHVALRLGKNFVQMMQESIMIESEHLWLRADKDITIQVGSNEIRVTTAGIGFKGDVVEIFGKQGIAQVGGEIKLKSVDDSVIFKN